MEVYQIREQITQGLRRTVRQILFSIAVSVFFFYVFLPPTRYLADRDFAAFVLGLCCGPVVWLVYRVLSFALLPARR